MNQLYRLFIQRLLSFPLRKKYTNKNPANPPPICDNARAAVLRVANPNRSMATYTTVTIERGIPPLRFLKKRNVGVKQVTAIAIAIVAAFDPIKKESLTTGFKLGNE